MQNNDFSEISIYNIPAYGELSINHTQFEISDKRILKAKILSYCESNMKLNKDYTSKVLFIIFSKMFANGTFLIDVWGIWGRFASMRHVCAIPQFA